MSGIFPNSRILGLPGFFDACPSSHYCVMTALGNAQIKFKHQTLELRPPYLLWSLIVSTGDRATILSNACLAFSLFLIAPGCEEFGVLNLSGSHPLQSSEVTMLEF